MAKKIQEEKRFVIETFDGHYLNGIVEREVNYGKFYQKDNLRCYLKARSTKDMDYAAKFNTEEEAKAYTRGLAACSVNFGGAITIVPVVKRALLAWQPEVKGTK